MTTIVLILVIALTVTLAVLIIYIMATSRARAREREQFIESQKKNIIREMKPADITPVKNEIRKIEEVRSEIKDSPADNNSDVDELFEILNRR